MPGGTTGSLTRLYTSTKNSLQAVDLGPLSNTRIVSVIDRIEWVCLRRQDLIIYYGHRLWFYWLLATPVVSVIVGAFLMVSITVFDTAYDPAYSAFQIEDYKHFLRFKLSAATKELHCYVIGVRKVHKVWSLKAVGLTLLSNVMTVGDFLSGCSALEAIDLSPLFNIRSVGACFLIRCSALQSSRPVLVD